MTQEFIQNDWETREFIDTIEQGVKKIAEFLNNFGLFYSSLFYFYSFIYFSLLII